ncbi:MAG TPA: UDP-N-acetylmuramoyl-L-alanine--D-glutamate ligase [Solirubrobacteraceae bacterium]|jgi:UDP-N-acetylmuramoylalanine--D-glutamate ligase
MKPRPPLPAGPYLILGLARSGVAAAAALAAGGARVVGVDAGAPRQAAELDQSPVEYHLENDGLDLLEGIRTVVKSPGVPQDAPVLGAARARGLRILGELELAWRILPNEFIAVTATNGKTTTVELIGQIHRDAGLPVAVAGNVGTALSTLVGEIDPEVTVVCEASSFQLEDTLAFAPEAAVLLNIQPDHLDRHGTFEDYRRAKLRIFDFQDSDDLAVLPSNDALGEIGGDGRRVLFGDLPEALLCERDGALWWRAEHLLEVNEIRLPGAHNLQNAMAAAAVCLDRGVPAQAVRSALRSFPGVAHRLEEIARPGGVIYVNDSKATNIASTLVALRSFPDAQVHLILGGQGKGQDFTELREPLAEYCRAVYLIGEDAPAIAAALQGTAAQIHSCEALEKAVHEAHSQAQTGEIVLLSPACASFDQFTDFQARGERFKALVLAL